VCYVQCAMYRTDQLDTCIYSMLLYMQAAMPPMMHFAHTKHCSIHGRVLQVMPLSVAPAAVVAVAPPLLSQCWSIAPFSRYQHKHACPSCYNAAIAITIIAAAAAAPLAAIGLRRHAAVNASPLLSPPRCRCRRRRHHDWRS
jgi:hypothetical protein